jgi:hypothetical protein
MKTFRELISWELEQDSKQKPARVRLSEDGDGKLSASVLSKIRYLNATGANAQKGAAEGLTQV